MTSKRKRTMKKRDPLAPGEEELRALLNGVSRDPHAVLGMRATPDGVVARCYDPDAKTVTLHPEKGRAVKMRKIDPAGLFATIFPKRRQVFKYELEKQFANSSLRTADPYCFLPGIGDFDLHLFNGGEHYKIYEVMGARPRDFGGVTGTLFTVWAPNARGVAVVGDFNNWDGRRHPMRMVGESGVWELFIPDLDAGEIYKFEIHGSDGRIFLKQDPYARRTELRPKNGAIVTGTGDFDWNDADWMTRRETTNWYQSPMSVYEVHLASWRGPGLRSIDPDDEDDFHTYREIAPVLADYVLTMGFTHVELLPIAEHPFDQSWGYQVTGFYAPTSRHGSPEDFAYFVDHLHQKGIGVILDWVPAHFPKDAFSLARFDGSALYEHLDPRRGEHRDWGTHIFNHGRHEVRNFLIGNALYWFDKFHVDGLRVDAVASMLYLNYSREDGEWIPNEHGGNEDLEALGFIKRLNELTNQLFPGTLMIAEESTSWPGVSRPVHLGGLGFSFKWNMGWMHDTLNYFSLDPVHRSFHHHDLTFSMLYAFSENFILPLSHDEVVHGKKPLIDKMSGDYWQKFANLRALYAYMTTHPGKKLLFMGDELGQWNEWYCKVGLDWNLLDYPIHQGLRTMVADLNRFYRNHPSLWECDFSSDGFEWIDANDTSQSVYSYVRWDANRTKPLIVIANLTPVPRQSYRVGAPYPGPWREVFNTDHAEYGGSDVINEGAFGDADVPSHGMPHSLELTLPPLGVAILSLE